MTLHTQWNPVTHCCWPMSLCAAGCIQHAKLTSLKTLPSPGSPKETILSTSQVQTLVHCVAKHSRPPDLKSTSNISLQFAWIIGPRKRTQLSNQTNKGETARQLPKIFRPSYSPGLYRYVSWWHWPGRGASEEVSADSFCLGSGLFGSYNSD